MSDPMADALEALLARGGGVKAIAKAHGVSPDALRQRWDAHRGRRPPVDESHPQAQRAAARRTAPRARARGEDADEVIALSPVERLEHELAAIRRQMRAAEAEGKSTVWAELNRQSHVVGKALDAARLADAAERHRRELAELRDPGELARQVLEEVAFLVPLAPETAREIYAALRDALGEG